MKQNRELTELKNIGKKIAGRLNEVGIFSEDRLRKVGPVTKLKWLDLADPVLDAKKAIKKGDYRLRAIFGYAVKVPGIEQGKYEEYEKIYGFNPIEGTSDALVSAEHVRLQHLASKYALKYNKVILNISIK